MCVVTEGLSNGFDMFSLQLQHYKDRLQAQGIYLDFLDEPMESLRRKREGAFASYIYGHGNKKVKVILAFFSIVC